MWADTPVPMRLHGSTANGADKTSHAQCFGQWLGDTLLTSNPCSRRGWARTSMLPSSLNGASVGPSHPLECSHPRELGEQLAKVCHVLQGYRVASYYSGIERSGA